ncbi:MAG TPA: right-handed parallel beta-helix repeat-containing protein [Terracidiphilus sp.]|nr:right-handed parallel beta-helix repeat-containing protein [Terracidiphilus sp.]
MPLDSSTTPYGEIHRNLVRYFIGLGVLSLFAASSLTAATLCVNPGGKSGCKSSISAAVAAASPGDTIQVAQGTYKEDVVITKSLSLVAQRNAQPVIDATGLPNGIFVNGLSTAPTPGVADVLISGFKIEDANFEGILVVSASDVTILDNHVLDNDQSVDLADSTCPSIPAFETNEGDDCGEGIHLMAADHSSVIHNDIEHNTGGILITDETGTSHNNVITGNFVHDNPYDCGITIASHGPATTVIPSATVSFGVFDNTVAHNDVTRNGFQVPGAGAGVGIFAPFPGTRASGNVVIDNDLHDNGLPGVTMHNHAAAPAPAPPVNMNDNMIIGNRIRGNGQDTEDAATSGPTGINVFSVAPVSGTVVSQNTIRDESIAIAFNAPSGQVSAHLNNLDINGTGVDNIGTGLVNATYNWWNCAAGPGTKGCATIVQPGVVFSPWLTSPFDVDQH